MSAAYDLMPQPQWAATTTVSIPGASDHTAEQWARAVFDVTSLPPWVRALFAVREVAASALRLPPGDPTMLAVNAVVGSEAIIDIDEAHLRFVAAVRQEPGLVHVTTLVTLKGWRSRLYFAPVRLLHDVVTRSMMTSAARRLGA